EYHHLTMKLILVMSESIPAEVVDQLRRFNETLAVVEDALQCALSTPFEAYTQMRLLDRARVDVMSLFAINSLYWMLLCTRGKNPKENDSLTNELARTKQCMERLKEIEDRASAPRLNRRAASNFVRNALWEVPQRTPSDATRDEEEECSEETVTPEAAGRSSQISPHKRPADDSEQSNECDVDAKKMRL
uniref:Nuclear nucleic acid-binding protein C1D n=2 Tax=Parascaris univalens TaxID=6257 RepID=A0A914ZDT0_PARUN